HAEDLADHVLLLGGQPVEEVGKGAFGPILVHRRDISSRTERGTRPREEHGGHRTLRPVQGPNGLIGRTAAGPVRGNSSKESGRGSRNLALRTVGRGS